MSDTVTEPGMIHTGELTPAHRARVAEILRSTVIFRDEEVDVALELFDETFAARAGFGSALAESATPLLDAELSAPRPGTQRPGPASPDYVFVGAFTPDDQLVGYACYGPTPGTDRTFDLYWIAVDRAVQGSGGGTVLLEEVERRLRTLDARMLVIETSSRSEYSATRGFYLRRGYDEAARVGQFYAPDDDRIIFTKRFQLSPDQGPGVVSS